MARNNAVLTPAEIEVIRHRSEKAIAPLKPPEQGQQYRWADKRTNAGRNLPEYYLVYFLLVELLKFPKGGRWEKVAWTIPVDFNGNAALIEHRKMGLGIFSAATPQDELIAAEIVAAIQKGIGAARPFFDHLAAEAVMGSKLNVTNKCAWLFSRFVYLRDEFRAKIESVTETSLYTVEKSTETLPNGTTVQSFSFPKFSDLQEARWVGIAAIDAFFSWTEHVLIHIGILLGNIRTGEEVARLADSEWSEKVKAAIDLSAEPQAKALYEDLLEVRRQIRNFMAHGAFGKQGQAFQFHSAAGAVPVNLTESNSAGRFSIWTVPAFDEHSALELADRFVATLWEGKRDPAKLYLEEASLPVILTFARDGTYAGAMSSRENMASFVDYLTHEMDNAANMDW